MGPTTTVFPSPVIVSVTATWKVRTPTENPQPRSGLTCGPVDVCVPSGAAKLQSNLGVPVKPTAEPTNVQDTLPLAGAMHGRFWTVKEPVTPGTLVVDVVVVAGTEVVVEVGGTVVVVDVGPLPPLQAATASIIMAIAIAPGDFIITPARTAQFPSV